MRVLFPLVDGMAVRPHLRELLLNHALMAAHRAGDTVLVPRNLDVVEVSESRMQAERRVLEKGELSRPDKVKKALQAMRDQRKEAAKRRRDEEELARLREA